MSNPSSTPDAPRSPRTRGGPAASRTGRWTIIWWLLPLLVWFVSCFYFLGDLGRIGDDWSLDLRRADTSVAAPATATASAPAGSALGGPDAPIRYHWPDAPFARWNYFWRPAHLILIHALATFAWDAHALRHALNALLHACCAALLYRLLRRFDVRRPIAMLSALALLAHPVTYEAALWPSTVSTLLGVALMLLAWTRAADIGSGRHTLPKGVARRALVPLAWGAFTFLVACFYEQPAGAIVLAGLLALPPRARRQPTRSLGRLALLSSGPLAACALYVALLVSTAPREVRGGSDTFKTPVDVATSLWASSRHTLDWIAGPGLLETTKAAARVGLDQLHADGWLWPVLLLFVASSIAWIVRTSRARIAGVPVFAEAGVSPAVSVVGSPGVSPVTSDVGSPGVSPSMTSDGFLGLTFLGGFVCALLPTALTSNLLPQPRLLYLPLLCVIGLTALVMDRMLTRAQRWFEAPSQEGREAAGSGGVGDEGCGGGGRSPAHGPFRRARTLHAACLSIALACIATGALAMLGFQTNYRARARADADQLAQLVRLVPDPPPGAVFMPIEASYEPFATGARRFDRAFPSAITLPWASWAWVQSADGYRRRDLFCTHLRLWRRGSPIVVSYTDARGPLVDPNTPAPQSDFAPSVPLQPTHSAGGFEYRPGWATPPPWIKRGGQWIEWNRCIPFSVGVDGRVRLVHTLSITGERGEGQRIVVRPPIVQSLRSALDDDDCIEASLHVVGDVGSQMSLARPLEFQALPKDMKEPVSPAPPRNR